jgi:hypothetical protein
MKKFYAQMLLAVLGMTAILDIPSAIAQEVKCYRDDRGRIVNRRRPGYVPVPCPTADQQRLPAGETQAPGTVGEVTSESELDYGFQRQPNAPSPVPRPPGRGRDDECLADRSCMASQVVQAMPDRWRLVDAFEGYEMRWWDPYNRNKLKADRPVQEDGWFFNLSAISDTVYELRDVATPVGSSTTDDPDSLDVFGSQDQWALVQNFATEFVYYKGNTVFQPPDWEFRFTPVVNINHAQLDEVLGVDVNPGEGTDRTDSHLGIQAAFVDKHLRNVSERYDFDSLRVGIQPFSADFRGFLFQDNQLGIRLFGTRADNRFQYNLAWFRRIEKDTNSGLNDISEDLRDDDVVVANLYWQDMPVKGFTSQATVLYNRNGEDGESHFNTNGFIERPSSLGLEKPRKYDVTYVGYNGDGHFGRLNLTASAYYAFGQTSPGVFVDDTVDIRAGFLAAEASFDFDWIRARMSLLYGSGDDDPFDDEDNGFDAVFENPQFAGADTSYWIRQAVPLIGGGRVALSGRNGVLNSLRSSKEEGQSNFTNPGIRLIGIGADFDVLPVLRVSANWNYLRFDTTEVLEVARNQADIDEEIGHDVSLSITYRPSMSQNVVIRGSYARLIAGKGFRDLFPDEDAGYFLLNVILTY